VFSLLQVGFAYAADTTTANLENRDYIFGISKQSEVNLNQVLFLLAGKDGAPGAAGRDGIDGINGLDGINGKDGQNGIDGRNGVDGINGKDGINGINGTNGTNGFNSLVKTTTEAAGANWRSGRHGNFPRPREIRGRNLRRSHAQRAPLALAAEAPRVGGKSHRAG
jgi:hypothetical protein